ncbi:MAG: hypothetical protein CM1200mP2_47250 [Planctomycetaceae bacterium]|nr:MAG: hypothetical protein CM1200mP2_47250 [Planctomycetaceae bacterium]
MLVILVAMEAAGWIGDHLLDFRQKLLWRLTLMEVEAAPTTTDASTVPDTALWIRISQRRTDPEEPYRVGQTKIQGPGPWVEHLRLTPETCPGLPGQRTFVLGGSAAFGYPYHFDESLAALADVPSQSRPPRSECRTCRATSSDIVPIARTILEHYDPPPWSSCRQQRVVPLETFWTRQQNRPGSRPATPIDSTSRSLLATLSHSRALAALASGVVHLVHNRDARAAPVPVTHDDGFVEHHALTGARHAIENPLTPERYDASQWPEIRQKYLQRFRENLATIITESRSRKVRVILMTMPFQYPLAPAWKQRQPPAGNPRHLETMTRLVDETLALQDQDQPAKALERIREAIRIDPMPPVPHYLEAELLESLERPVEAEAAYARSREAMIGNLGSRLSINRVIREVAAEQKGPSSSISARSSTTTSTVGNVISTPS